MPAPADPTRDPRYEEGVRLFNEASWFECHEVLESLWRDTDDPSRLFYQGLIMAAVALEHWRRGNPRGARSQWAQGRSYLRAFPDRHARLDLDGFVTAMDHLMVLIMRHDDTHWRDHPEAPGFPTGRHPRIRLDP